MSCPIPQHAFTQVVRYPRRATGATSDAYDVVSVWKTGSLEL